MVRNRNRNRNEAQSNREPAPATTARAGRQNIVPPAEEPDEPEEHTTAARGPRRDAPQERPARSNGTRVTGQSDVRTEESNLTDRQASRQDVVTQPQNRALGGVNARNAFESYGQQMSISSITGTLIKFNKGDWVDGDNEELDENMELVANMDQLMVGWIKWQDQRPAEQIMGPVAEGYQPQRRNELGDLDQNDWEVDDQGRPQDPWQFSNYIVMKEPGQDASEDNLYTFATSSKGGLGALGSLCRDYGKEIRGQHANDYPIVQLGTDSYMHRVYGRTKIPLLTVVGWEPKEQFEAVASSSTVRNEPEPEPANARSPARGRSGGGRSRAA